MQSETGESTAAQSRRWDGEVWPYMRAALERDPHLTLFRPLRLDRYYVAKGVHAVGGIGSISSTMVRRLEAEGQIVMVAPSRYALTACAPAAEPAA